MLPSFVCQKDANKFSGLVFAIDLGGTNFRVIRMTLERGKLASLQASKYRIPDKHIEGGTHEGLFGCIADKITDFFKQYPLPATLQNIANAGGHFPLGFTFSFPVDQKAIDAGNLINWTKGFTTTGVEGKNVVELFQKQIDKRDLPVKVVALCNDTVGTLVTRFFDDDQAEIGCILGTGANACYWEARSNIVKLPHDPSKGDDLKKKSKISFDDDQMIVNMEFGNFDSKKLVVLPVTQVDPELDEASPVGQKGKQRFEKMISGKYLGEIARRLLVRCSQTGFLPAVIAEKLTKEFEFDSRDAGLITSDRNPGAPLAASILRERYGCEIKNGSDIHFIQQICGLVQRRSAQLAGMALAAILLKTGKQDNATVAVDGSVYSKTPGYQRALEDSIAAVLGDARGVRVRFTSDGSGLGAGYIAALTQVQA
jgi:hexokinase